MFNRDYKFNRIIDNIKKLNTESKYDYRDFIKDKIPTLAEIKEKYVIKKPTSSSGEKNRIIERTR